MVRIPQRLLNEAMRRGVDVEEIIVKALAKALNIDLNELARVRLEVARECLEKLRRCWILEEILG